MFEYPVGSNIRFLYDINNFDSSYIDNGPYFSIKIGQLAEVRDNLVDGSLSWLTVAFGGNLYMVDSRYVISEKQWDNVVDNIAIYTKLTYKR